jgi:threonine dehydrogenase-like Zn-dependent dehydrogenase
MGEIALENVPEPKIQDPVEVLRELTCGSGPDRVIDAVGVGAATANVSSKNEKQFETEMKTVGPDAKKGEKQWWIGGAPNQAIEWAVVSVAKAGTLSIIGVYPPQLKSFPIGEAMNKNLTVRSGNCNHRKYLPHLIELVRSGVIHPEEFFTLARIYVELADNDGSYTTGNIYGAGGGKGQP